jgi:hypothetical protein
MQDRPPLNSPSGARPVAFAWGIYGLGCIVFFFGIAALVKFDVFSWQQVLPVVVVWAFGGATLVMMVAIRIIHRLERNR